MDYSKLSPGMQQYMTIKEKHRDCIVLFRMGDFYETFYDDAKLVAKELEITLTARGKGDSKAPLAGLPYHALEPYLTKLVKKGFKVAIVEQLEDPKKTKTLVKRGVVRIVTSGTLVDASMLDSTSNNYIMAIYPHSNIYGIAVIDISTGEFLTTETEKLDNEITRFQPSEVIIPYTLQVNKELLHSLPNTNSIADVHFMQDRSHSALLEHFKVITLNGFGLQNKTLAIKAAGALITYLHETQFNSLQHINKVQYYTASKYMTLDTSTIRNLELLQNILDNTRAGTLISTLDKTSTPMGSRLLKKFILQPLLQEEEINKRLDKVEELKTNVLLREELKDILMKIQDIERLIGRVSYGNANPRDILALKLSLENVPALTQQLQTSTYLKREYPDLKALTKLIEKAIQPEPPVILREGNFIKAGYNEELDKLKAIMKKGKSWVAELEQQEREKTKIQKLRVGYNNVFGYYFAVTKAYQHLVPDYYIRKQTLVNEERYITPELKEQETTIITAAEKSKELEQKLFHELLATISMHTKDIQLTAINIAELDVFLSLAHTAAEYNYVKPIISTHLHLKQARHPVVEQIEDNFVPNDCNFTDSTLHIITGSNMAGKSTIMRQVALIQLLAQLGSFVPAKEASIPIVDRIFTRVGAYDDLTHGQSTFMVEMLETANILNNVTKDSLVILDEIGRGTSTYDGIALAWAIAEHLHEVKAKTLFATHYHQLNNLATTHQNTKNFNVTIREAEEEIIFLHKLVEGGTDKSYGIEVARLAGIPQSVIKRSKDIMNKLETEDRVVAKVQQKEEGILFKRHSTQITLDEI